MSTFDCGFQFKTSNKKDLPCMEGPTILLVGFRGTYQVNPHAHVAEL